MLEFFLLVMTKLLTLAPQHRQLMNGFVLVGPVVHVALDDALVLI